MRAAPQFDFDELMALHAADPQAFEARKQALLAIELARCSPQQAEQMRAMLERYEHEMVGASPEQRMIAACQLALRSLDDLGQKMDALADDLRQANEAGLFGQGRPKENRQRGEN